MHKYLYPNHIKVHIPKKRKLKSRNPVLSYLVKICPTFGHSEFFGQSQNFLMKELPYFWAF